mmetsp:Transcript_51774/g.161107  ORF Transcript_51774/g.161107 Transcript_51774/m.161107 type:complete len:88 (+) Transcript_51774:1281-1544(+)
MPWRKISDDDELLLSIEASLPSNVTAGSSSTSSRMPNSSLARSNSARSLDVSSWSMSLMPEECPVVNLILGSNALFSFQRQEDAIVR